MSGTVPDLGALLWPIVIVVFLFVILTFAARYRPHRGLAVFDQSQIRLVATRRLGLQSSLILIEVDGQRFLVAATRASVVPLTPLPAKYTHRFPDEDEDAGMGTMP